MIFWHQIVVLDPVSVKQKYLLVRMNAFYPMQHTITEKSTQINTFREKKNSSRAMVVPTKDKHQVSTNR